MPKKLINTGTSNDSGNGDSLRSAFTKINENFNELYTLTGSSSTASEVDIKGSVFADDSTLIVDGVNGILNGNLNGNVTGDVTGNVTGDLTGNVTSTTSSSSFANLAITSTLDLTGASVSSDVNFGTNDLTGINNITIGGNLLTSAMSPLLATSSNGQNLTLAGGQSTSGDGGDAIINAGSGTGTNGDVQIGSSNTATIIIGDGSNTVDYPNGTTVDFTGTTVTGLAGHTETDPVVGAITGIVKADGAGNISAAVAGTDYLTTVAFADITSKPTTVAGYGITDAITSVPAQSFASLTGKPTTLAGYGITDAATLNNMAPTGAVDFTGATSVDFTGATISGTSFLTSVPAQSFASLTGKPTTIAGYGITDALALGTSSTTALAGDTALFSGAFADLTSKPTTIAGYGITDALALLDTSNLFTNDFKVEEAYSATPTTKFFEVETGAGSTRFMRSGINMSGFGTSVAPKIDLTSYRASPADGDAGPELVFRASTAGSSNSVIATIETKVIATASGAETTEVSIHTDNAGTSVTPFKITGNTVYSASLKLGMGVEEKFSTTNGATGVTEFSGVNGHVHYLTAPAGDITANFTNLNGGSLTAEYATNVTVIVNQGATARIVSAVQIGGAAQTINWQGGSAPTGTTNGIDAFSFTILNDGGSYVVLGQMVDFT